MHLSCTLNDTAALTVSGMVSLVIPKTRIVSARRMLIFSVLLDLIIAGMLIVVLTREPQTNVSEQERLVAIGVLVALLLITPLMLYVMYRVKRGYKTLSEVLSLIKIGDSKLVIPKDFKVERGRLEIYKIRGGKHTYVDIKFSEAKPTLNVIDLSADLDPYAFSGIGIKEDIVDFYYSGTAYKISSERMSFYLIPLWPSQPVLEKSLLDISKDDDYAYITLDQKDHSIEMNIMYNKVKSKKLVLEIAFKERLPISAVIATLESSGTHRVVWEPPILEDTIVIAIPDSKYLLGWAIIEGTFLKPLRPSRMGDDRKKPTLPVSYYLLGFYGANIVARLDIPFGPDVKREIAVTGSMITRQ